MSMLEPASFECDRRLSRAAREIVQRRILPFLSLSLQNPSHDVLLRESIRDASTCILHPNRDVLLNDELNSIKIPTGPSRLAPRRNLPHWYECGVCGKTFLTRYYLDLHFENTHSPNVLVGDVVCPAISYCHVLGGCDQVALELEPYYGRGSGGAGPDAPQIRQMWRKRAHSESCNETKLEQEVRPSCEDMMRECFTEDVADELIVGVCDMLTCHHRLDQLAGHVAKHVHSWKRQWDEHHNHSVGWVGAVVVTCLGVYYCWLAYRRRLRLAKTTIRLLSKKPSSSPWRRKPTKKKLH
jgi:hypothetical protein